MAGKARKETATLKVGDEAPDFSLNSHNEGRLNLSWYQTRKNVVLAFFPGAFTPVCTTQIPGYQEIIERFEKHEVQLLGISVDTIPSLKAWANSMGGLSFPLLSDFYPHGEVAKLYGVFNPRGFAERAIILIDKAGVVQYIEVVDPAELPDTEVLFEAIEAVPEGPTRPDEYLYK